jgi:hypothetical protein
MDDLSVSWPLPPIQAVWGYGRVGHMQSGGWRSSRVTIGLPVRNGENFLAQAIESVLAQTFPQFALLISDNASTDRTAEIAASYAKRDDRITVFRQKENIGAAGNFNFLLREARGDYFKWAAHDDMLGPDFLRVCVERLDSDRSLAVCHTGTLRIDAEGKTLGTYNREIALDDPSPSGRFRRSLWVDHFTDIWGLMRREAAVHAGPMRGYVAADRGYLSELMLQGRIGYVPGYHFFRRDHGGCYCNSVRSTAQRRAWFDPSRTGPAWTELTSKFGHYFSMVCRAPVSMGERARCAGAMAGWCSRRIMERLVSTQANYRPVLPLLGRGLPEPLLDALPQVRLVTLTAPSGLGATPTNRELAS